MAVVFDYDTEGWRPTWGEMIDMIDRFCHENETAEELRWLRSHPVDWMMVTKYLRERVENHIAESRKKLKEIEVTDPETGRPRREYLRAKADTDSLNRKRLHWRAGIIAQQEEARYIMGWDRIPEDMFAFVVERLLALRMAMTSALFTHEDALGILEALIVSFTAGEFDPDAYRPRRTESEGDSLPTP